MFTLAIVGRPNVGKSTLFNCQAGKSLALTNDTPGLTRDWREAESAHLGSALRIIDTAGLEEEFDDSIQGRMRRQTEAAARSGRHRTPVGVHAQGIHDVEILAAQQTPQYADVRQAGHDGGDFIFVRKR